MQNGLKELGNFEARVILEIKDTRIDKTVRNREYVAEYCLADALILAIKAFSIQDESIKNFKYVFAEKFKEVFADLL